MKRYRILGWDFDTSINALTQMEEVYAHNPTPEWKAKIDDFVEKLMTYYGKRDFDLKLQNLRDIGAKSFSIIAHHNVMLHQIREAFIYECYYPALTSACTLGERILNHITLDLKENYRDTEHYSKVNLKANSNWNEMIDALNAWGILLPEVVEKFRLLKEVRNKSIHFNQKLVDCLRDYSLQAVRLIQEIIFNQFSGWGSQPWFLTSIPGELYIKKEWETNPFIAQYYLPNCLYVGYQNKILSLSPFEINDDFVYQNQELTDEEYSSRRIKNN